MFDRATHATFRFSGWLDDYLKAVTTEWLLKAPDSNPAMLEMFRDRDRQPHRDLLPWSGEFAGKYLTSAVQVYRLNHDPKLLAYLKGFVADLIACQDSDGYLGPWPKDDRLAGHWDPWNHYHIMFGLLLYHEETGDAAALDCAKRIADLVCSRFLGAKPGSRLVDVRDRGFWEQPNGWINVETNVSLVHSLSLLYEKTGEPRYLAMAEQIVKEFEVTCVDKGLAGNFVRAALEGLEFYQFSRPRWEGLHAVMGVAELYHITGNEDYRKAFEHIWWSIVKTDRHNNGGFSSGEGACGDPYNPAAIETCCTIAWTATGVEMLRMTGSSVVADELELTTLNSVVGMHSPTGRWSTYDTPMDGVRRASTHSIVFQAREGSPELNCCSVNAARGFGMISDWAVMRSADGVVVLNYYGPSTIEVGLDSGNKLKLTQKTEYPADGRIALEVSPARAEKFALSLRIPYWSAATKVKVNGEAVDNVAPGKYLVLSREWKPKDKVEIQMDMSLHYWAGEKECEGKTSVYRGPILLTYDRYYNDMDPEEIPTLNAESMRCERIAAVHPKRRPIVLMEFTTPNGQKLRLCDFGSAGYAGTPYRSWLKVDGVQKTEFSLANPLRSGRYYVGHGNATE